MRASVKLVLMVLAANAAALVLAALALRLPVVWPFFPDWLFEFLRLALHPIGQEEVADVEFLGFWLVCLAVVTSCAVIYWALASRRASSSPNARGYIRVVVTETRFEQKVLHVPKCSLELEAMSTNFGPSLFHKVSPAAETPNPSIEGTLSGLRPPSAPHVNR
jgi:hypothetical protein